MALSCPAFGMPTIMPYCCCTSGLDAVGSMRPNSSGGPAYLSKSGTSVEIATERGRVRLHLTTGDDAGAALVWHTGSQRHTLALQAHAARRGLTFRDGLLSRANGALVATPDEDELYRHLGLPFIAPEALVRPELEHVSSWDYSRQIQPGVYVHDDYDLERPSVELKTRKGVTVVDADESPRRDSSLETLAKLPPAFVSDKPAEVTNPVVTAGNAPGLNDGARVRRSGPPRRRLWNRGAHD